MKNIKKQKKYNYLVLVKSKFIRDTQYFTKGKILFDENYEEEAYENCWKDVSGDLLVLDRKEITREELDCLLKTLYPETDQSVFRIIELPVSF